MESSSNLVEVANDFVEESEALEALFVDVILVVELFVVGDAGEHDGDVFVALTVQFLRENNGDVTQAANLKMEFHYPSLQGC